MSHDQLQSSFGDEPPYHLMGWAGGDEPLLMQEEKGKFIDRLSPFQIDGITASEPGPPVWEFAKRLNDGEHLPTWFQETGDCVSMGAVQAGQYTSASQIVWGQEQLFKFWFPPFIYQTSRVLVGKNQLRGPGSLGSWAAEAMIKYGALFSDDPGVPRYSGSLADKWGRAQPDSKFMELASDNKIRTVAPLSSVAEIREALLNYHMVTIASMRGFNMTPMEYKGYHVFTGRDRWPHQMCFIGWMDEPFEAAYRLNSWGLDAHGNPLNGEPPGGAWNFADDIEKELQSNDVEVYAMSLFDGFPAAPDFNILSAKMPV